MSRIISCSAEVIEHEKSFINSGPECHLKPLLFVFTHQMHFQVRNNGVIKPLRSELHVLLLTKMLPLENSDKVPFHLTRLTIKFVYIMIRQPEITQ